MCGNPLGVAVDLRIGEALQKLPCPAGVIQVNVRQKDVVDGADAQFIEPLNEVRDGGGRSRIDQERHPADLAYPGADELPEPLEGPDRGRSGKGCHELA
ncbi:MAG: hypothetical protein MZU91_04655 [Desulfosudis oleivorans]|nr:hypothetical protein [Desulfosudis oleivorans]